MKAAYRFEGAIASRLEYEFSWIVKRASTVLNGGIEARLRDLLQATATELGCVLLWVEVTENAVRLGIDAPSNLSPKQICDRLKADSASALRQEFKDLKRLPSLWTRATRILTQGAQ
jgi:putative transposase